MVNSVDCHSLGLGNESRRFESITTSWCGVKDAGDGRKDYRVLLLFKGSDTIETHQIRLAADGTVMQRRNINSDSRWNDLRIDLVTDGYEQVALKFPAPFTGFSRTMKKKSDEEEKDGGPNWKRFLTD